MEIRNEHLRAIYALLRTIYAQINGTIARFWSNIVLWVYLQQQLHPLDGSHGCFGDGSSNTTRQEILHKTNHAVRHVWMFHLCCANPHHGLHGNPTLLQVAVDPPTDCPNIWAAFIARGLE